MLDQDEKRGYFKKIIYGDCAKAMAIPFLCNLFGSILSGGFVIFTAGVVGKFADAVLRMDVNFALQNIYYLFLCLIVQVIFVPTISCLCNIIMLKGALFHDRIIYGRFLNKKYENILRMEEGEVQYQLENDPNDFRYYLMEIVTKCLVVPFLIVYLAYSTMRIHILFTVIIFGISFVKLMIPILLRNVAAKYDKEVREYETKVRSMELEISGKPNAVKRLGLKEAFLSLLDLNFEYFMQYVGEKNIKLKSFMNHMMMFVATLDHFFILLIGAIFVAQGRITPGAVASMFGYTTVFYTIFDDIQFFIENIPIMNNVYERSEILYLGQEEPNKKGKCIDKIDFIEADNLCFSYSEKMILNNFSFKILHDKKNVIVGKNGTGKSTVIKIISGLLCDYQGKMKCNGIDFTELSLESWRAKIAYAMQDVFLFDISIKDNIRLGNLNVSEKEVEIVMERVGLSYLLDRKENVTITTLSGGERQRISIARALLKKAEILIMDEPNSNLDAEGMGWLKGIIHTYDGTVIFISHNKELIECSDYQVPM